MLILLCIVFLIDTDWGKMGCYSAILLVYICFILFLMSMFFNLALTFASMEFDSFKQIE